MDVSDIFYFFCSGRGKGESEAPEGGGGGRFLIESPRRGGVSRRGGAERPGGCLRRIGELWGGPGGGGPNFFFRGRNVHQG